MTLLAQERFRIGEKSLANALTLMFRRHMNQRKVGNRRPEIFKAHVADEAAIYFGDDDLPPLNLTPHSRGGKVAVLLHKPQIGGSGKAYGDCSG